MGHRCCSKQKVKKGLWSPEEDEKLLKHITTYGHGSWSSIPKLAVNPPSGFGLLDENYCMWGTNNSMVVEPFGGPSNLDGNQQQQQQQQQQQVLELQHEKGQVCEMETDKIDEVFLGFQDNMDSSFDSSSFDFEFVESTFMSGAICRDLSSMDDFAWNF
ncbi:hypothetical protein JRO89_XS08G0023800 [Xanthoceras sorbifolium]|uniref:Uncharacterized protein n=1 Tax=Xanthoceras sorbifolium TaxID=99658 RepID=A0ABQ8HNB0_9ROSI|nr:hypothetical protein JRO89_XS08G0023800 [Xanthoceras sorbifolium]